MSRLNHKKRQVINNVLRIWNESKKNFKGDIVIENDKVSFPVGFLIVWIVFDNQEMQYFKRKLVNLKIEYTVKIESSKKSKS